MGTTPPHSAFGGFLPRCDDTDDPESPSLRPGGRSLDGAAAKAPLWSPSAEPSAATALSPPYRQTSVKSHFKVVKHVPAAQEIAKTPSRPSGGAGRGPGSWAPSGTPTASHGGASGSAVDPQQQRLWNAKILLLQIQQKAMKPAQMVVNGAGRIADDEAGARSLHFSSARRSR